MWFAESLDDLLNNCVAYFYEPMGDIALVIDGLFAFETGAIALRLRWFRNHECIAESLDDFRSGKSNKGHR